jgi:hypothetical protein
MASVVRNLFFWQSVYAQNTRPPVEAVPTLTPAWIQTGSTSPSITGQLSQLDCSKLKYSEKKINSDWRMSCICESGQKNDKWDECLINTAGNLGISCDPTQLLNGTCRRNINKTLGIRNSDTTPNPTVLLQDIILTATSFVGTLIVIALLVTGAKYIRWWYDESSAGDLKKSIKNLLIWLFLVIWSYTIIRLIQYIARGY